MDNETASKVTALEKNVERLTELNIKKADLLRQLVRSLKVKAVWPEAFKNGGVQLKTQKKPMPNNPRIDGIVQAWLVDCNNEQFVLNHDELEYIYPEKKIHPNFAGL